MTQKRKEPALIANFVERGDSNEESDDVNEDTNAYDALIDAGLQDALDDTFQIDLESHF